MKNIELSPLDKRSPIYERFNQVIKTFGPISWVVTSDEVIAKSTPNGKFKSSPHGNYCEFDKEEIKKLSPILLDLIKQDANRFEGPTYKTVKASWEFWHEHGTYAGVHGKSKLFVRKVLRANTNVLDGLNFVDKHTNICMTGYMVSKRDVAGVKYPYAHTTVQDKTLSNDFLDKHFPDLLVTYTTGFSLGLTAEEIEKLWLEKCEQKSSWGMAATAVPDLSHTTA